jgi:hypothetical protein
MSIPKKSIPKSVSDKMPSSVTESLNKAQKAVTSSIVDILKAQTQAAIDSNLMSNFSRLKNTDFNASVNEDFFVRWEALDKIDYNASYSYDLLIVDNDTSKIKHSYTFPINPSSISINVPSASSIETTMKGIVVTENGAPLRQISISGTTGTAPVRNFGTTGADKSETEKTLNYLFKNTIKAVDTLKETYKKAQSVGSQPNGGFEGPLNLEFSETYKISVTGYESIHDLARFLDIYMALKKQSQYRSYRLILAMHKDQMYYKCKLDNYSITKQAGTLEYSYNINFTAFQRLPNINEYIGKNGRKPKNGLGDSRNALSAISQAFASIKKTRQILADARNVLKGIRGDINDSIIQPMSDMNLALKDILGIAMDASDFYNHGTAQFNNAIIHALATNQAFTAEGVQGEDTIGGTPSMIGSAKEDLDNKRAENTPDVEESRTPNASPTQIIKQDPLAFQRLLEKIDLDTLELTEETKDLIDQRLDEVRALTSVDFMQRRELVADCVRSISEAFGGGSTTYNRIMGVEEPKFTYKKLTVDDIILLKSLNDAVLAFDSFCAHLEEAENEVQEDYYSFYQDYAISAGIPFETNSSRFFVPFPYEATLEQVASQYLGDPERWIEIAAVNGLKAPYIDEIGIEIPVTASSGGNTLTVSSDLGFYVGQVVQIFSDTQKTIRRKVRSLDVFSAIETIITFEESDDSVNLSLYKPSQNAKIRRYAPNTVNSNMLIAIPSNTPATFKNIKTSPEISQLNGLARMAGIDMMLSSSGDIILMGGGEVKMATGLTNIIQAAMLKLNTKLGSMIQHPDYGNGIEAGNPTSEVDLNSVIQDINNSFGDDERFSDIIGVEVKKEGPSLSVSILVGLSETDVVLPISAQVPI